MSKDTLDIYSSMVADGDLGVAWMANPLGRGAVLKLFAPRAKFGGVQVVFPFVVSDDDILSILHDGAQCLSPGHLRRLVEALQTQLRLSERP